MGRPKTLMNQKRTPSAVNRKHLLTSTQKSTSALAHCAIHTTVCRPSNQSTPASGLKARPTKCSTLLGSFLTHLPEISEPRSTNLIHATLTECINHPHLTLNACPLIKRHSFTQAYCFNVIFRPRNLRTFFFSLISGSPMPHTALPGFRGRGWNITPACCSSHHPTFRVSDI